MFNIIDFNTYERAEHYNYYIKFIKSKINMSYNIDITEMLSALKENNLKFYPSFIYVIISAINEVKEMRMAKDKDGNLGYFDRCEPSYTIFHKDDHTFSDIWSYCSDDFYESYKNMTDDMEKYKNVKGVKAKENKPENFIPISCVPWLSFSSCSYDTYSESHLLFPVIVFGKYYEENGKTLIPMTVFVPHAVCDGYHICKFFEKVEYNCKNFKMFIDK